MTLNELSAQYRCGGESCRAKVKELEDELEHRQMSETERYKLRRRLYIASTMMREQIAMSRYLENYYGGKSNGKEYVC